MSIVSINIGQCGNQVGSEFYSSIIADNCVQSTSLQLNWNRKYVQESLQTFFYCDNESKYFICSIDPCLGCKPEARCVQIDMEEKVIRQINNDTKRQWSFPQKAFYSAKRGSGNTSFDFV